VWIASLIRRSVPEAVVVADEDRATCDAGQLGHGCGRLGQVVHHAGGDDGVERCVVVGQAFGIAGLERREVLTACSVTPARCATGVASRPR
jgi:hypothetical protein